MRERARRAVLTLAIVAALVPAAPARPSDVHHIHGLAVDRRDPDVLYVATHTGLVRLRPGVVPEWTGEHRFDLMGFTAHPSDPNVVWASGHPDPPTYRREGIPNLGLLLSRDGGRTWQSVALRGQADFHALAWSPREGGTLYGWSVAGQTGLHRITTKTWTATRLAGRGLDDVLSLSASPDAAGSILAGTVGGLRASRDGGESWSAVSGFPAAPTTAVAYHPSDARIVYAYAHARGSGLLRSRDGGATWETTGFFAGPETPAIATAVGPGERIALATTAADVLRSRDGGRTWQKLLDRGRPPASGR